MDDNYIENDGVKCESKKMWRTNFKKKNELKTRWKNLLESLFEYSRLISFPWLEASYNEVLKLSATFFLGS